MKKIDLDFQLYLLSCLIMGFVFFELFSPYFNYYLGQYSWWLCLVNVVLFLVFNSWQNAVNYKLDYSYGKRNANLILTLIATVIVIIVVQFFDYERTSFELSSNIGGHWLEKEVFWDLFVLLFVNIIILTEEPFFEKVGNIIDEIRS